MAKQPAKTRRTSRMSEVDTELGVRVKSRAKKQAKGQSTRTEYLVNEEVEKIARRTLVCKGNAQKQYKQKIESSTITFSLGPAGTGKTYVATMIAAKMMEDKQIERIIVTRPAVADEDYGALPGDLDDKLLPWFIPVKDILADYFGSSHVDNLMGNKKIVFVPIGHLRGRSFHNAFVILDEAQNTTPAQMKTFLTRIGAYSKVAITGDLNQTDIRGDNGLADAVRKLKGKAGISVQVSTKKDIVRSDIVKVILDAYEPNAADDLNLQFVD